MKIGSIEAAGACEAAMVSDRRTLLDWTSVGLDAENSANRTDQQAYGCMRLDH
jgi:hypothetical protein